MNATRRQFLAGSVATGSLIAAGIPSAGQAQTPVPSPGSPEKRWKCGIGLNGFMSSGQHYHKTYPIWEVLDFAAREGFDGVELVEGWPMGGYPPPDDAQRVAALKRMYDQYGLRIYTMQTFGSGVYSADPAARQAWLKGFADQVRLCKALGGAFVGHWPGGGLAGNADVDHAIDSLVAGYKEAAKVCADAGMYFSFEIEPPFLFHSLDHLERILRGVDNPACKTNYDSSHFDLMSGAKGKPEEMLRQLGVQYIGHVHLTDTDGTLFGGTSRHLPCGEGHCDIRASLKTLWDGGYQGWLMIDAWLTEDPYHASHNGKQAIDQALAAFSGVG